MAKLTNQHQRTRLITSSTDNNFSLHSEDDFGSGCQNVSHQQQFFLELLTPGRSHYTITYWFFWLDSKDGTVFDTKYSIGGYFDNFEKYWYFQKILHFRYDFDTAHMIWACGLLVSTWGLKYNFAQTNIDVLVNILFFLLPCLLSAHCWCKSETKRPKIDIHGIQW